MNRSRFAFRPAAVLTMALVWMLLWGSFSPVAFVGAMGFVLSSTAVIMQMLEERGEIAGASGVAVIVDEAQVDAAVLAAHSAFDLDADDIVADLKQALRASQRA